MTLDAAAAPSPDTTTPAGPSLSPSRAADFKTCPLLFRFRTIDRLPERTTTDQVRGTLVHAVLERLFDLPAAERTPDAAAALVAPEWARLVDEEPELAELFADIPVAELAEPEPAAPYPVADETASFALPSPPEPPSFVSSSAAALPPSSAGSSPSSAGSSPSSQAMLDGMPADETARLAAFLRGAGRLLEGYFAVEDPTRLEPAERESLVSTQVGENLQIRGYIDRLDISPAGDLRVVDYKTGGAPREAFEGRALFQLKFYALVLWRTRGVVPRVLRLLYLKDEEICDYSPDAEELERFERTLLALSEAIERAKQERDFRPKPSRLCDWCSHQARCPTFGGTPPPYPEVIPVAEAPTPAELALAPTSALGSSASGSDAPAPGSFAAGAPAPGSFPAGAPAPSTEAPAARQPPVARSPEPAPREQPPVARPPEPAPRGRPAVVASSAPERS